MTLKHPLTCLYYILAPVKHYPFFFETIRSQSSCRGGNAPFNHLLESDSPSGYRVKGNDLWGWVHGVATVLNIARTPFNPSHQYIYLHAWSILLLSLVFKKLTSFQINCISLMQLCPSRWWPGPDPSTTESGVFFCFSYFTFHLSQQFNWVLSVSLSFI